jgi:hypothetical protein
MNHHDFKAQNPLLSNTIIEVFLRSGFDRQAHWRKLAVTRVADLPGALCKYSSSNYIHSEYYAMPAEFRRGEHPNG